MKYLVSVRCGFMSNLRDECETINFTKEGNVELLDHNGNLVRSYDVSAWTQVTVDIGTGVTINTAHSDRLDKVNESEPELCEKVRGLRSELK